MKETLEYKVKSEWNELSKKQVRYVAENWKKWQLLMTQLQEENTPINDKILSEKMHFEKVKLLIVLSDLTKWTKRAERKLFFKYLDKDIVEDAQNTNFIFKEVRLTKNFDKSVRLPFIKHYPPESIYKLTGVEFAFAEKAFYDYMVNGHIQDLNMLVAILYRKKAKNNSPDSKKYTGDIRQEFNQHSIDYRQKRMWMLSKAKKTSILLWYAGSRQELIDRYKHTVFAKSNNAKPLEYGWLSIFRELAGKDITKQLDVAKTNITIIMMNLDESIKESKRPRK